MATLNFSTLVPTSIASAGSWAGGTVTDIDELIASYDSTVILSAENSTDTFTLNFTDMPTDFVSIATLSWQIKISLSSYSNDTEIMYISVTNSSGTAFTDEATVATNISGVYTSPVTAFTINSTGLAASRTDWNGALIKIRTSHSANMGADNSRWSLDCVNLTGTYNGGTGMQINIGDTWKTVSGLQINIGDTWKTVTKAQINIGDTWKTIF